MIAMAFVVWDRELRKKIVILYTDNQVVANSHYFEHQNI